MICCRCCGSNSEEAESCHNISRFQSGKNEIDNIDNEKDRSCGKDSPFEIGRSRASSEAIVQP